MKKIGQIGGHYFLYRTILSILAGVLLISFPEVALEYVTYAVGALAIVMGIVTILSVVKHKDDYKSSQKTMMTTNGVINIMLGIMLLVAPTFFIMIMTELIGIFIVIAGILQLFLLWQRKRIEKQISAVLFFLPLILIGVGLIIIFYPFETIAAAVRIMGIIILFYGILELIIRLRIHKYDDKK